VKIYTRRGDRGETDLFGGPRVPKDDPRVVAYGGVDELNAVLGLAAGLTADSELRALLQDIQGTLFDLGAYLATPDPERRRKSGIAEPRAEDVTALETHIDAFDGELEPLRNFVLPGGTSAAGALHLARTVCRRAERQLVGLDRESGLAEEALGYLNRLSDLLFTLARVENRRAGVADIEWTGRSQG